MQIIEDWQLILHKHILLASSFISDISDLHTNYIENKNSRSEIGFNVFTLSSDFYYRENFHSDIVKSFLDPNEKHNEGSKYLNLFIDLLNKKNNQNKIRRKDFSNSTVVREKYHIDILITDNDSKKAIIIENKLNNAVDQNRQLPKYVDTIKCNYEIVAVVYLTLNSSKRPDKNDWSKAELKEIDPILFLIPAYESDASKPNLFNDWIIPSIINSANLDSSYLLRQYGNLIKFLNTNTMDTVSLEKFYFSLKENKNFETAISIRNMLNDLPEYLAIRIEEKYKEKCYPFNRVWRYQQADTVFDGFYLNDLYFKLDIFCRIDGYFVQFWRPNFPDYNIASEFKPRIKILSDFTFVNNEMNKIFTNFKIFDEEKLLEFIDIMLSELRSIKENWK